MDQKLWRCPAPAGSVTWRIRAVLKAKGGPPSTSNIYQLYLCNNNVDIVLFQNIQTTTTKILWLSKLIFLASSIILGELFSPQVDIAWLRLYPTLGAVFRIWYTLNQVIAASTKKKKQPCFWVSRRIRAKSERCGLSHTLQQNKCLKHNWRKMEGCRRQAMLQEWFWEVAALAFIPFFALGVKKKMLPPVTWIQADKECKPFTFQAKGVRVCDNRKIHLCEE